MQRSWPTPVLAVAVGAPVLFTAAWLLLGAATPGYSQRADTISGGTALSVVLSGRSNVTGQDERVTVFTRELHDDDIIYALFIAPGVDYTDSSAMFNRVIGSIQVNDAARHP